MLLECLAVGLCPASNGSSLPGWVFDISGLCWVLDLSTTRQAGVGIPTDGPYLPLETHIPSFDTISKH